jgi:hypothetical protein
MILKKSGRWMLALIMPFALIFSAMAPAACSTIPSAPSSITIDEKALYVVELGYAGAIASVDAAVEAGVVKGDLAVEVDDALDYIRSAILTARSAYATGDRLQAALSIAQAHEGLASLREIITPEEP